MRIFAAAMVLFAGAAWAPAQASEPARPGPGEAHGDWTVLCIDREGLPPCEVAQAVRDRAGKQVLRFSIAYGGQDDRYGVQFLLPTGILVQGDVLLRLDDKRDLPGFRITRCEVEGCFIDRILARKDLDPFYQSANGRIAIADRTGQPIVMPLSFNGFAQAMQVMIERNRNWAQARPPAARLSDRSQ